MAHKVLDDLLPLLASLAQLQLHKPSVPQTQHTPPGPMHALPIHITSSLPRMFPSLSA